MSPPLILAIQPDKRQASQLASIVRGMSAELLLMESTERAMAALGERLPDLILTPALLSQRDETALAERLRKFGDAAAHIQTLTIPILETTPAPSRTGVLSALRKPKRKGRLRPDERLGCTADAFAEQISIYLNRAVEVRRTRPKPRTEVPAAPPAPVSPPEVEAAVPPHTHRPEKGGGLPSIEELSARTPTVPERDGSLERSTGVITVRALPTGTAADHALPMPEVRPRVFELPTALSSTDATPSADEAPTVPERDGSLERSTEVITVMALPTGTAADHALPMPEVRPRVFELPMALSSAEATTPADEAPTVPERDGSLERSTEVITVMASADQVADHPVPMPEATRVAELPIELSSIEATPVDEAPVVPELNSALEKSIQVTAVIAPSTGAANAPVPMPEAIPRVAELPMALASIEAPTDEIPDVPVPDRSLETGMTAVVTMAPDTGASASLVPMPAVMPRVAELPMRLPAAAVVRAAVPVMPEPHISPEVNMAAVAAMVPDVGVGAAPVPVPEVISHVAEHPMELSSADTSMPSRDALLVPAPLASPVETSFDMAAAIASCGGTPANAHPVSMPPVTARVAEIRVEVSGETLGSGHGPVPIVPTPPAGSIEMSMATVAAMVPLAAAAGRYDPVPIPAVTAPVAELPIKLPLTKTAISAAGGAVAIPEPAPGAMQTRIASLTAIMPGAAADGRLAPAPAVIPNAVELPLVLPPDRALVAPAPPATLDRSIAPDVNSALLAESGKSHEAVPHTQSTPSATTLETAAMAAPDAGPPVGEPHAPAPPAVSPRISKADKKKKRLQARKAARKKGPPREDVLDNPFDPEQCRFSALIAKLDEVVTEVEQSEPSDSSTKWQAKRRSRTRKTRSRPN